MAPKTDVIEQLRARVAELEAENSQLIYRAQDAENAAATAVQQYKDEVMKLAGDPQLYGFEDGELVYPQDMVLMSHKTGQRVTSFYSSDQVIAATARLEAEVEHLRSVQVCHGIDLRERDASIKSHAEKNRELRQQLAAAQLSESTLITAIDQYLVENDPSEFGCACDPSVGHLCGPCFAHKQQTVLRQALSTPADTSALDAYVAEKVKEAGK